MSSIGYWRDRESRAQKTAAAREAGMVARSHGNCGGCDHGIRPGETIVKADGAGRPWRHKVCPGGEAA